jgi:hypothetical protein
LDGLLVALACAPFRLLHGKAQRPHQPGDVIHVIADAIALFDQAHDSRAGPKIGTESLGERSPQQPLAQALALSISQSALLAWSAARPKAGKTIVAMTHFPATNRPRIYTQSVSNCGRTQAVLDHSQRSQAPPFGFHAVFWSSHTRS